MNKKIQNSTSQIQIVSQLSIGSWIKLCFIKKGSENLFVHLQGKLSKIGPLLIL